MACCKSSYPGIDVQLATLPPSISRRHNGSFCGGCPHMARISCTYRHWRRCCMGARKKHGIEEKVCLHAMPIFRAWFTSEVLTKFCRRHKNMSTVVGLKVVLNPTEHFRLFPYHKLDIVSKPSPKSDRSILFNLWHILSIFHKCRGAKIVLAR